MVKKAASVGVRTKKKSGGVRSEKEHGKTGTRVRVPKDLSDAEADLVSHMEQGWRLETNSLGGNPVLRELKHDEVIRPLSANRSTVEALQKRGVIVQGKGGEPLTIVWQLRKEKK
jgi:hypothetical protein